MAYDNSNIVEDFRSIQEAMALLYKKKNEDYGSSIEKGVDKLGNSYIAAMIFNKTERFINLASKQEDEINYESIEDTLFDIAVYATEGLRILQKKRFIKETANDNVETDKVEDEEDCYSDWEEDDESSSYGYKIDPNTDSCKYLYD